jgi:ribosomal protein L34E
LSEKRKYRKFTPEQKVEIVSAGLRGASSSECTQCADVLAGQQRQRALQQSELPRAGRLADP